MAKQNEGKQVEGKQVEGKKAKRLLENTTEHQIDIHYPLNSDKKTLSVPPAMYNGNTKVNGRIVINEDALDDFQDNPVVKHYVTSGALVDGGPAEPETIAVVEKEMAAADPLGRGEGSQQ